MKKLLVFVLSAVMAVCMCGFAVTAFAESDPVALGLPAVLGADENYFTAEVSPSLYTEEGVIEYDIANAPLSSVVLSDGSKTASVTHFRNEPAMGRMKFYDTNGFMNFKTAAKGSTITFKANATFTDRGTTYTFGDKDVVYECDGNGGWTKKAAEKVTLSPVAISADENMFRLTVSPSLYAAEGVSEYDIPGAPLSSVVLSDGSKTASITHFRNEPAMGCMKFYDTNAFMNFKTAAKGATITLKGNTTFVDHDAVYTFGEEDIVFVCDGNGVWTKQTAEEPEDELWTTDVLSDGTLNVPSYEGNSVKFDGDKISVNLSKATAANTDAYDISASFNRIYKGDFTLSFRFSYLSPDHTGDRFFIFSAGDYSFLYCPYWGDGDASLLAGTNYSSDGAGRIAKTNPGSEFTVKFVRNGDVLSLFIDGELLGSASGITAEKTQFTMKARRVICELSGIRGSGDVATPVKPWTSEDFAASAIDVPEFENNSVSTANDKLTFDLSANAGATDFTKEATVSFDKEYAGDFAIEYTLNYLSVSNTGVRYLMFTIGDSYALMYCPYNADVQLLQSTTYDTKRVASMSFSANEGTFRVVRSGNKLSFYVNGNKLGDTQTYSGETAKFGFKAHRVTADISDFKAEGTVKEEPVIPVDPDAGKTFVNWGTADFADSEKDIPEYDGNYVAAEDDKLTISLSKNTAADSAGYDSSVTFGKVYEGDFTLEFTLTYLSVDHTGLRYVMFTAGGYGIAYCPYCEKIHFYRGEEYHGDGLIEEPEFKGVTQFRFRIVAENGKLNVKVNDTAFTEQDYTETETVFGFKARRTISGISDWKIAGSVKTAGNAVSTDVFRFVAATGAETPTFAINRNLGSVAFATENADLSAVKYLSANGQKVSVTSVNYSVSAAGDMMPSLLFLTSAKPAVGDKITVNAGFSFTANGEKISTAKTYVAEYTANGWTGLYATAGETISVAAGTVTVGTHTSSDALVIDFGLMGVKGASSYFDDATSGWHQYDHTKADLRVYEKFAATAIFVRDGKRIPTRYVLSQGKFAFAGISGFRAGDGIILLKGLTVYEMNEANYNDDMGMVRLDESYAPVFVLGENLIYRYDGTNFVKAPAATSASIVNEEELLSLRAGTTAKILWSVNEGAVDYPKFYSDNENVATVDGEGNVSALTQGEVTFTLAFAEITKTITVTVGAEPAKTGIRFELATSAQRDGKSYFVAYVGETLDLDRLVANLSAYWIMEGGVAGTEFAVTKDMIDAGMFDNSRAGETKVVLNSGEFSVDVPVYVYEVVTTDDVQPSRLVSFGSAVDVYFIDSVGGSETSDVRSFNIIENPLYGIPTDIVTLRKAALDGAGEYALHSVGQVSNLQCILFFNEFDMSAKGSIPVGTVLSFNKNFRFWRYTDETWIAAYKFKNDVSYVWTGTEWTWFEADAREVTVPETSLTLPVGAEYAPAYNVLPENSYYVPSLESSEPSVATIENGKIRTVGEGSATISLKFGSRRCTIALTVVKKEIVGVKLADERVYNLSVGGALDLSKISVYADYGDGIYGEAIALTDDNASYELDSSAAGKQTISMTVYVGDKPFKLEISVAVWNVEEVYPDNIACYDDAGWFMGTTIGIFFQKTFGNMANVYPYDLPGDEGRFMTDYVTYTRAGETVECDSQAYLTYIFTVTPKIGGKAIETYLVGDTITLKKGMGFYKWFGETDANNVPQGAGDYVKVGELKYDMTFTYNENKKFFLEIPVADAKVLEETVSVGMGETHATNVAAIPSYCSNAEWFFAVSDPSVASVSAQGLIKGLKIGTTTVTATLKTIAGDTVKDLTYTVSVTDSVSGILITSEKAVELTKGEKFDFASVKERFGVKAVVLMVSGATGKEVDLSGARITGYDPDQTGEQTVTFRITVDGKSVTGELKVTVKEEKKGCSGSAGSGGLFLLALLPIAVLSVKKKGETYAD